MAETPFTYFKVSPRDFDPFLLDTQDLSINRGGSLTLLEMPRLLRADLERAFADLEIDVIQQAASELFFRVSARSGPAGLTIGRVTPERPREAFRSKQLFNRALEAAAQAVAAAGPGDDPLRAAAERMIAEHGITSLTVDRLAGMILTRLGSNVAAGHMPISEEKAQAIRTRIGTFLGQERQGWPLDLFRFGVACHRPGDAGEDTPARVVAALETDLALQQQAALNCPVPPAPVPLASPTGATVCHYTNRFGADAPTVIKGRPASRSAWRRFEIGRKEKRNFYARVLEEAAGCGADAGAGLAAGREALTSLHDFANDFEQLVANPPRGEAFSASVRAGMAVLWMDGNGFGKRRSSVGSMEKYRAFSDRLDHLKAQLLARVLCWIKATPAMQLGSKDGPVARFETLLWGGDEFGFVCPAWAGWALARLVTEDVATWTDHEGRELTFSMGLAFAPHDTPISQLREAASGMADQAKGDRKKTRLIAMAFEGVDRVHLDAAEYRARLFGAASKAIVPTLEPADLERWSKARGGLELSIGRSALHRFVFEGIRRLEATNDLQRIPAGEDGQGDLASGVRPDGSNRLAEIEDWISNELDRIGRSDEFREALTQIARNDPKAKESNGEGSRFATLCILSALYDYIASPVDGEPGRVGRSEP